MAIVFDGQTRDAIPGLRDAVNSLAKGLSSRIVADRQKKQEDEYMNTFKSWLSPQVDGQQGSQAPPPQTPFDTCPTCEALARTVMMDQTGTA